MAFDTEHRLLEFHVCLAFFWFIFSFLPLAILVFFSMGKEITTLDSFILGTCNIFINLQELTPNNFLEISEIALNFGLLRTETNKTLGMSEL